MKPIRSLLAGVTVLTVTACVPQPKSAPPAQTRPAPAPEPTTPPPAPVYDSWMDAPQTPGDWLYGQPDGGSLARFGERNSEPRFAMACDQRARQLQLVRYVPGRTTAATMVIRTESQTRSLAAAPAPDGGALIARLAASDRLLDAMALSKGRFAVEVRGTPTLYLPSWAEVTRVIEDCR